ncbi:probable polyribonucleotide nucleotidyltransferase 1, chloroplastic [Selaginella moellendorffii]|uniref:probable polyribonucleotide nucleotidyltransferase 1, chloroplastic n=1 Tax=Selaginella moellendorffii TaxID=88036 RepID=UPI000D1C7210|nr:probable polyribonucleotide nucleotidyltransferase 1, chloroplastic [Selaginella moellendorffii]|eukprot:XP_002961851.2 probable polyribonucleotide nucleotidyltransferase 1, chloroplastic [Selaginella moellendorffii]
MWPCKSSRLITPLGLPALPPIYSFRGSVDARRLWIQSEARSKPIAAARKAKETASLEIAVKKRSKKVAIVGEVKEAEKETYEEEVVPLEPNELKTASEGKDTVTLLDGEKKVSITDGKKVSIKKARAKNEDMVVLDSESTTSISSGDPEAGPKKVSIKKARATKENLVVVDSDSTTSFAEPALQPELGDFCIGPCRQQHSVRIPVGDRQIVLETGSIGRQAGGAVTISDGETILYTTVCTSAEASEPSDFVPLYVHYHERYSAAGRTSGGFNKREGKPRDSEVFISRLVDRPLRPMIPKGYFHEIQVLSWVLSYDGSHLPEPLAITAAGAALALSDVPVLKPVAGVRVGYINGKYVLNPTASEVTKSSLDMIMAGTSDGLLMIEGYCNLLSEDELVKAVETGQRAVKIICKELEEFGEKFGRKKRILKAPFSTSGLEERIKEIVGDDLYLALHIRGKQPRAAVITALEKKVWSKLTEEGVALSKTREQLEYAHVWDEDEIKDGEIDQGDVHITPTPRTSFTKLFDAATVKLAFKEYTSKTLKSIIAKEKVRSDGRGISDVRPISCSCNLLPRAHGSAIFTRGETQALVAVILGGDNMAQRIDGVTDADEVKRFYVQYVFPHSCVGEVGRIGPASRREIGHGRLIERSLEPIFPSKFPYTVRVESTITESNGSSSMASVCGAYLALCDAGVPVKCPIAGVAMGLILDPKEYGGSGGPVILTDILGSEDACGDMDLKVAGSKEGITAFQMDLKVQGINLSILKRALSKAKTARCHILKEMTMCSPPPSTKLSKHVDLIDFVKVGREKVNMVVGTGGKTVRQIIDDSGVESVDVSSDGSIRIVGKDRDKVDKAMEKIRSITTDPTVGTVYRNCPVKSLTSFGCFLEISPGREGLCHISELTTNRLSRPEEFVAVGERLDVKVIEVNSRGQIRLSHRAILEDEKSAKKASLTSAATKLSKLLSKRRQQL